MPNRSAAILLGLVLSLCAPPSMAAGTLLDTLRRTGLTQEDINRMTDTAAGLYRSGSPKVGRTVSWTNPETEAKGSVKLVAFRGNCAYLQHFVITTRRPKAQEFRFKQCRTAAGDWILTP